MEPVPVQLSTPGTRSSGPAHTACVAPQVHLYFQPDGDVRACCRNQAYPLGNVATQRLRDIWDGVARSRLIEHLARDDYALGCDGCGWEVQTQGAALAYPRVFDALGSVLAEGPVDWPTHVEFNLSNSCNLQCIQCNGELSSSIRIHREHKPALPTVYDDRFFDDLVAFLPHLRVAQFAGGEPFLGAENYRAWDLIAEQAPHVRCGVVTNATQWNQRVEAVLEKIPMDITISLDSHTEATYEAIRVGADHGEVMANIDRFLAYAAGCDRSVAINHCLMTQNAHEFGDFLLWAEERGIAVNVSVVHYPVGSSIARMPSDDIRAIADRLRARSDELRDALALNAAVWDRELERLEQWAAHDAAEADHDTMWSRRYFLGHPRVGPGAHDGVETRAAFAAAAGDVPVHEIVIGPDERIVDVSDGMVALTDASKDDLLGEPPTVVDELLAARFGPTEGAMVLRQEESETEVRMTFGSTVFDIVVVAERDADGFPVGAFILARQAS